MSEEEGQYQTKSVERTAYPPFVSSPGYPSAGAAASGDAAGCLLGSSKQRDRDYCSLTPYYRDAWVTIYHGDWRKVLPKLQDETAEIAITSPPYNLVSEYSGGGPNSTMKRLEERKKDWYPDELPEAEYQNEQRDLIEELLRVCASSVFYNHKVRYAYRRRQQIYHPMDWVRSFQVWCEIVWDRGGAQGGNSARFLIADERIYQIRGPRKWKGANGLTTVWRIPPAAGTGHVCAFPEQLAKNCIVATTDERDTVLDPCMGSGTTMAAAKEMNRLAIGIEREERYCEIAAKRLQQEVMNFAPAVAGVAGETGLLVPHERANTNFAQSEASQRDNGALSSGGQANVE